MTALAKYETPALPTVSSRDTVDGWALMLTATAQLAREIAATDFVPKALRDSPAAVTACILAGRELGIGPMASLQHLYVIEGRPSMSAQLMRGLVLAHGHELVIKDWSSQSCSIYGRRAGQEQWTGPITFTMDDARRARLDRKPVWQAFPDSMLLARATGKICRAIWPDVIGGMVLTAEEAADLSGEAITMPWLAEQPQQVQAQAGGVTVQRGIAQQSHDEPQQAAPVPPSAQPAVSTSAEVELEGDEPQPIPAQENRATQEPGRSSPERLAAARARLDQEREHEADQGDPNAGTQWEENQRGLEQPATREQEGMVFSLLRELYGQQQPREERLRIAEGILSQRVTSFRELTQRDAGKLIDTMVRAKDTEEPQAWLEWIVDQGLQALDIVEGADPPQDADVVDGPWQEGESQQ